MGMSGDYPVAVEEGATLVRVGRAIFGERAGAVAEGPQAVPAAGAAPKPRPPRARRALSSPSARRLHHVGVFLANFLQLLVLVLWALVLARVVVSWVDPQARNPISGQVVALTEPFLAPIRRLLPATGGLDLSPLILMLVLSALLGVVGR